MKKTELKEKRAELLVQLNEMVEFSKVNQSPAEGVYRAEVARIEAMSDEELEAMLKASSSFADKTEEDGLQLL